MFIILEIICLLLINQVYCAGSAGLRHGTKTPAPGTPIRRPTRRSTRRSKSTQTQRPTRTPTQRPTQTPTQRPTQTPTQRPTTPSSSPSSSSSSSSPSSSSSSTPSTPSDEPISIEPSDISSEEFDEFEPRDPESPLPFLPPRSHEDLTEPRFSPRPQYPDTPIGKGETEGPRPRRSRIIINYGARY